MAIIRFRKTFIEIPPGCLLKVFVELTSGHLQSTVSVFDSDPITPNQQWFNDIVLRTTANPNAEGTAPIVGPAGCVMLANLVVAQNGTAGKMVSQVVDQNNNEIRKVTWSFGTGTGLTTQDTVNGALFVQLA